MKAYIVKRKSVRRDGLHVKVIDRNFFFSNPLYFISHGSFTIIRSTRL